MYNFLLQANHAWHSDAHEPLAKQHYENSYIGDSTLEDALEWPWGGQYSDEPHTCLVLNFNVIAISCTGFKMSFEF